MAEQATPEQLNRFVAEVDTFKANYAKLISPDIRTKVYASGNSTLINEYESNVSQGRLLQVAIDNTVGAWNAAKQAWRSITGATSTVAGDIIDEIHSWFGYQPVGCYECELGAYSVSPISGGQLGALGAFQLPAAVWVAGIISAAYLLNQGMTKIFISVEASRLQRADPTLSRSQALVVAAKTVKTASIFGGATLPLILAAGITAFLIFGRK